MTKDEAMKLALEALESCGWNDGYNGKTQYFDDLEVGNAITALREALDHYEERLEMVEPVQERRVQQQFMDEEVLYSAPPRREWVSPNWQPTPRSASLRLASRSTGAIEAKLKEKNCGS